MSEMKTLRLGQVWSPVGQNISFENGAFARLIRKKKRQRLLTGSLMHQSGVLTELR